MANIEIDGKTYPVKEGDNLLQACLSLGLNLPYFCWHPSMGSVGACRQCAIIQYNGPDDNKGRLVMSCMTPVTDGTRISLENPKAKEFREDILELLMTNHPHDCPVCEEGGECHLQDMTVMTGHTTRIYRGKKRTHKNQYLGPFINHEMNRCIACYRCVRYYQDYAGGHDLNVFGAHNDVFFGRHEDGVLENEFSGNLVEVCPTGVFTDKTLSNSYSRKWDLQTAPSICNHCALGCNTSPGERYGQLKRIVNRYHGEVNGYFLCDRGRFGSGFVNSDKRIRKPLIKGQPAISKRAAEKHFVNVLKKKGGAIGIGSPRATLESNFALRELVGAENFYSGIEASEHALVSRVLDIMAKTPAKIASLREVEDADAVLVLGEDVTNTAPLLALSIRQAIRNRSFEIADELNIPRWQDLAVREAAQQEKSPLFIFSGDATPLDEVATATHRLASDDQARLGFAIAQELDADAPPVGDLTGAEKKAVKQIAGILKKAKKPLIVSGTGCGSTAVLESAANIAKALPAADKSLSLVVPECNTVGLALLDGGTLAEAQAAVESGAETVVVLENNLYRRGEQQQIDAFLGAVKHLVVVDHLHHDTADKAELVLPAATFAETEGTLVNNEGRAQRFFSVFVPADDIQDSWRWLGDANKKVKWGNLDDVCQALAKGIRGLQAVVDVAPGAQFRMAGMKIPRQPHRYSGRTAMLANINVSEPKQPQDPDSPLSFSMEGMDRNRPPALNPGVWAPGWNSNQSVSKFQDEVSGHLAGGDPGLRLINSSKRGGWFKKIPKPFKGKKNEWQVMPLQHIFGSDELSVVSPALAERMPDPYVALHPDDGSALQVSSGDLVEIKDKSISGTTTLPVKLSAGLPKGIAGLPAGLPGFKAAQFYTVITITKSGGA